MYKGLTAVHICDRYVAKMRMSSLAYRLSYVRIYICIPMYVCKEKLTAGSGEVKMNKNEGRRRETLSPSGGGREGEGRVSVFPNALFGNCLLLRLVGPGTWARPFSHKGPRKSTVGIESISRTTDEGNIQDLGNGPRANFVRDISRFFTLRAPSCPVILFFN